MVKNAQGVEVHITSGGAAIQRVLLPDKAGTSADVVLGFDDTNAYVVSSTCCLPACLLPDRVGAMSDAMPGFDDTSACVVSAASVC